MKPALLLFALLGICSTSAMAQADYIPIEGEYRANTPNCAGQYYNNGFSISLYGAPIDADGMVDGAGDVVNLEFYTAAPDSPDFSIEGEYTFYDTEAWMQGMTSEKYGHGDLMGGFMYAIVPGYWIPMGTVATIYGEYLDETIGLASEGSRLVVTHIGGGIYRLAYDFYTPQDAHITGEWVGDLADCVVNCPDLAGTGSIAVEASEAMYYDLQGLPVSNPISGKVYIKVNGDKATKIKK